MKEFWETRWLAEQHTPNEFEQAKLKRILEGFPSDVQSVLDVGCGTGWMLEALRSHYRFGVGMDFAVEGLRQVKSGCVQGICTSLPFKAASFDLILCAELIEHLDDEALTQLVAEINRVARRYILITTPYAERRELNMVRCERCLTTFHSSLHVRSFTEHTLEALFVKAGFRKIWIHCAGTRPYRSTLISRLNVALTAYYPYFSTPHSCPVCGNQAIRQMRARENPLSLVLEGLNAALAKVRRASPFSLCALFESGCATSRVYRRPSATHLQPVSKDLMAKQERMEAGRSFWDQRWEAYGAEEPSSKEWERAASLSAMIPDGTLSVLDVGCGRGVVSAQVSGRVGLTVGLDQSRPALLRLAVPVMQGCVDSIPFRAGAFDLVLCSEVLEHLPTAVLDRTVNEITRVAARYILVSVPLDEERTVALVRCEQCLASFHGSGHVRSFGRQELEGLFARRGFIACNRSYINRTHYESALLSRVNLACTGFYRHWRVGLSCPLCGNSNFSYQRIRSHPLNLVFDGLQRLMSIILPKRSSSLCVLFVRNTGRGSD